MKAKVKLQHSNQQMHSLCSQKARKRLFPFLSFRREIRSKRKDSVLIAVLKDIASSEPAALWEYHRETSSEGHSFKSD